MTITEPGVYQLDEGAYHSDPVEGGSLSQSGAKVLLDSPAKFDHQRRNGRKAKKAWDVGTAAHREVLGDGPELVVPKNAEGEPYALWNTNDAKAQVAAARADGKVPLKQDELDTVRAMAKALQDYPVARALLDPDAGRVEQSLFHRDPETGVWMRMRADYLEGTSDQRLILTDYKSCQDASDEGVARSVENFRYHLQDDWYRHVVQQVLGLDHDPLMFFIFQETEPPYLVNVAQLDTTFRRGGEALRREALELYAECTATGTWPGYDQEISTISPPAWARGRYPREVFA